MPFPYAAGEVPAAGKLGESGTYTPAFGAVTTPPTLGDGAASGWWIRTGPVDVKGGAILTFGAGMSQGVGIWDITLPLPADTSILPAGGGVGLEATVGDAVLRCTTNLSGSLYLLEATKVRIVSSGGGHVAPGTPGVWVSGHSISIFFDYIIAPGS